MSVTYHTSTVLGGDVPRPGVAGQKRSCNDSFEDYHHLSKRAQFYTYFTESTSDTTSPKTPESGIDMNDLGCSPPCYSVTRTSYSHLFENGGPGSSGGTTTADVSMMHMDDLQPGQSKDGYYLIIVDEPEEVGDTKNLIIHYYEFSIVIILLTRKFIIIILIVPTWAHVYCYTFTLTELPCSLWQWRLQGSNEGQKWRMSNSWGKYELSTHTHTHTLIMRNFPFQFCVCIWMIWILLKVALYHTCWRSMLMFLDTREIIRSLNKSIRSAYANQYGRPRCGLRKLWSETTVLSCIYMYRDHCSIIILTLI